MIFKKNVHGQSMFEVVLALFIITMIIVAVVVISTNSISNSLFSRSKTQASRYSQEAVEWLRNQRETNFDTFKTNATGTWCLSTTPPSFVSHSACGNVITGTIFKRQVTFTTSVISGKNIINATVVTSWTDTKGYHEARAVTDFSDIREK